MSYRTTPVRLIGGRLCLDFLNTADWTAEGTVVDEKLGDLEDLATWSRAVGLDPRSAVKTAADIEALRRFRASLRRLFLTAMAGEKPKRNDLAQLNQALEAATETAPLAIRRGQLSFARDLAFEKMIALSAVSVLTTAQELERIEICPSENCGWLFLDESKNRRRRWCSMETCGNRAKARRHYQRHSGERPDRIRQP